MGAAKRGGVCSAQLSRASPQRHWAMMLSLMLSKSNRERPDSSLESLPALFFCDVCYLTRDQIFPIGINYTRQCLAGAEGSEACAAWFGQNFEDKAGRQGIGSVKGMTRRSWWSRATCGEGGGQIQSSQVSLCFFLPGLGGFIWIREGFARLRCQTSVYPQKPF